MTTDSHDNKLYKQQIVRIIVSPIYCWLLRLASKEPEYAVFLSCLYSLTAALPCKVGRDEYDRMDIENGNTTLKQKNPAVEILLSIRRTRPFRADRLPLYLCTIRNGIRNFACAAFAYNAFRLASSVSLTVGRLLLSMSSTIVPVSSV